MSNLLITYYLLSPKTLKLSSVFCNVDFRSLQDFGSLEKLKEMTWIPKKTFDLEQETSALP